MEEKENTMQPRLMGVKQLQAYTGLGMNRAAELGKQAGARVRYGSRVLYDRLKVDAYISTMQKEA